MLSSYIATGMENVACMQDALTYATELVVNYGELYTPLPGYSYARHIVKYVNMVFNIVTFDVACAQSLDMKKRALFLGFCMHT